jgi:hypothetical protein
MTTIIFSQRWKRLLCLGLLLAAVFVSVSSWLVLYGQRDPVIRLGMTIDEATDVAGKPTSDANGLYIGMHITHELHWQRGLRVTKVEFEIDDELRLRAKRIDHETIRLTAFLQEKLNALKQLVRL